MRGGSRKGFGGAQPGAGRKPDAVQTKQFGIKLTVDQHAMMKALGGSPWLQGLLNLEIQRQATKSAPVALVFDSRAPDLQADGTTLMRDPKTGIAYSASTGEVLPDA